MSDCCTPRGYRRIFSDKAARNQAKRYRKKGLDRTSQQIVDILVQRGVEGRTVLEVGGGIGAIQLELLRAGASRAVSVELTPTYEETAAELLSEAGLQDRVERRVVDFVAAAAEVERADIVVMNRVVCCYHDMPTLVGLAADHTGALLLMSFPKSRWWTRAVLGSGNLMLRLARREFHVFVRPSESIRDPAERRGMRGVVDQVGFFWETMLLERPAA